MIILGFLIAVGLFFYCKRLLERYRERCRVEEAAYQRPCGTVSWHEEWRRQWVDKFQKQAEQRLKYVEARMQRRLRRLDRHARRFGFTLLPLSGAGLGGERAAALPPVVAETLWRRRRRVRAQIGFYTHLMAYEGVMAILALVNLFTSSYPWFIWPALAWGIGLFIHYMVVFGSRVMWERYFDPAVEREVRREKVVMHTEKQASIDELSSTIAHEIRNPIAAAKSLVQQIAEDPASVENSEYARVAVDELDRVERSISHLLRYAKEEDYTFAPVSIAVVVDAALTEMRAKLDAARVTVVRNYIAGPTVLADRERMRQVFANILDNAIDALDQVAEGRRIDVFVDNGARGATVRMRDNGCGIPADRIDRIFNPFFTTKDKGTGLGMAISKKIVEAHEGQIDVVSESGRGAEFVVTLPLPQ